MKKHTDIYIIEQLILWLEDNVDMGSGIHFDNEFEIHSEIAVRALVRLLPHKSNMPFVERYLSVTASTGHLTENDKKLFTLESGYAYSRVAKRSTGYFVKLWECVDDAHESEEVYLQLSTQTRAVIDAAIKQGAMCIEFDCDAEDNFIKYR